MLKREKVHFKCTAWCSGVFFWFAQGNSAVRANTDYMGQELGQEKGLGLGLEPVQQQVGYSLQTGAKIQNTRSTVPQSPAWLEQSVGGEWGRIRPPCEQRAQHLGTCSLCSLLPFPIRAESWISPKSALISSDLTGSAPHVEGCAFRKVHGECSWFHFSCHSSTHSGEPTDTPSSTDWCGNSR